MVMIGFDSCRFSGLTEIASKLRRAIHIVHEAFSVSPGVTIDWRELQLKLQLLGAARSFFIRILAVPEDLDQDNAVMIVCTAQSTVQQLRD